MSGIHAMLFGGTSGGGGSGSVTLNNQSVNAVGAGTQTVSYQIKNDGYVYTSKNAAYTQKHQWTGDAVANYQVRATIYDGAVTSGTTGSWVSATSEWTVQASSVGSEYAVLFIEARLVATSAVVASCNVTLYAERT